jgi:hypothetical protein
MARRHRLRSRTEPVPAAEDTSPAIELEDGPVTPAVSSPSVREPIRPSPEIFVTETMAELYLQQAISTRRSISIEAARSTGRRRVGGASDRRSASVWS